MTQAVFNFVEVSCTASKSSTALCGEHPLITCITDLRSTSSHSTTATSSTTTSSTSTTYQSPTTAATISICTTTRLQSVYAGKAAGSSSTTARLRTCSRLRHSTTILPQSSTEKGLTIRSLEPWGVQHALHQVHSKDHITQGGTFPYMRPRLTQHV